MYHVRLVSCGSLEIQASHAMLLTFGRTCVCCIYDNNTRASTTSLAHMINGSMNTYSSTLCIRNTQAHPQTHYMHIALQTEHSSQPIPTSQPVSLQRVRTTRSMRVTMCFFFLLLFRSCVKQ